MSSRYTSVSMAEVRTRHGFFAAVLRAASRRRVPWRRGEPKARDNEQRPYNVHFTPPRGCAVQCMVLYRIKGLGAGHGGDCGGKRAQGFRFGSLSCNCGSALHVGIVLASHESMR